MAQPESIPVQIAAWRRRRLEDSTMITQRATRSRSPRRIRVGDREVLVLKRARHLPEATPGQTALASAARMP